MAIVLSSIGEQTSKVSPLCAARHSPSIRSWSVGGAPSEARTAFSKIPGNSSEVGSSSVGMTSAWPTDGSFAVEIILRR